MPARPTPIPNAFRHAVFTVEEATAAEISYRVLRNPRFERPHHGVYCLVGHPPPMLDSRERDLDPRAAEALQRARGYVPLLRSGEAFSHATALLLYGVPIHVDVELHVTVQGSRTRARGRGVLGHRVARSFKARTPLGGVPCVPPILALLQASESLSFRELVVAIDHLILPRGKPWDLRPIIDREALGRVIRNTKVRGVRKLRAAFEVARVGAESRMESLMHFEQARIGIDDVPMQVNVFDARGRWIGRFDQVDERTKRILEYDGEQHRTDRRQYLRDAEKLDRARRAGYDLLHLRKEDFREARLAATRGRICAFFGTEPRRINAELARYFAEEHAHPHREVAG